MSSPLVWQRSSFCGTNACVEVANVDGMVLVRNSGERRPATVFSRAEWAAFLAGVRAGEFEVPDA
jgi:hypothetical protein